MVLFFLEQMLPGAHQPGTMCQVVKDNIIGRKAMVTVPVAALLHVDGFLYTGIVRKLFGPVETRVSRKGMGPLFWGFSVVNCICGSRELIYCSNSQLCSACWMTKASSTYLSHSLGGLGT